MKSLPHPDAPPTISVEITRSPMRGWLIHGENGQWKQLPAEAGDDFASVADWLISRNPCLEVAWV